MYSEVNLLRVLVLSLAAAIVMAGVWVTLYPVRFVQVLAYLNRGTLAEDLIWYDPTAIARSFSMRTQIRLIGVALIAAGISLFVMVARRILHL